ncbi:MAG: outer membrane lipoprotein carrier protein LolA [Desulfuromonadales bacterium]|nr:outer membrane lipoprotein carrier protein LolA [Desulfuromonadales bacterium]
MRAYLLPVLQLAVFMLLATPVWAAGLGDVIKALETPFQAETDAQFRIYDYSAEFFQESRIASLDRLQRASGRVNVAFDYRRAGMARTVPLVKFRWNYFQPTNQEIVSDGKTLWVHLPENKQVILSDIEQVNMARENDPMTFLTGLGNLSRDFSIQWASPNSDMDGNHVLSLTPRRVSSLINRMVIVVDRFAVEAYLKRQEEEATPSPEIPISRSNPSAQTTTSGRGDLHLPGYEGGPNDVWLPIMSTTVYDPNGNSTTIEFNSVRVNSGLSAMDFSFIMPAGVQVVRPTGKEMGF